MEEKLFYICENVRCPLCENGDSEEVVELDMPLYEDYKFVTDSGSLNICNLKQLMTLFCYWGERCYISIKRDLIKNNLIKVVSTEAYIENDSVIIKYHFEDGTEYTPSADMSLDYFNKTQQKMLIKLAKEAAPHIFNVNCELVETNFKFINESWCEYYEE